jgi:hypothetical protein
MYYQSHYYNTGLSALGSIGGYSSTMTNVYSVDIVFTDNKDLWTRCVVLEASDSSNAAVGNARTHEPRKQASVGKDGKPDGTGEGMGWFPGYAINVETGERLNIMFSENSADVKNHGNDMLFNPTAVQAYLHTDLSTMTPLDSAMTITYADYNSLYDMGIRYPDIEIINGGKHYLYIVGSSGNTSPAPFSDIQPSNNKRNFNDGDISRTYGTLSGFGGSITDGNGGWYSYYDCGAYDEGRWLMTKFKTFTDAPIPSNRQKAEKMQLFNNVMWASIPMPAFRQEKNFNVGNDATVKLRVTRPYMRYSSRWYDNYTQAPSGADQNFGLPMYSFTTKNIAPTTNAQATHKSILDEINIVPNPYYGSSLYESTAVETYVKIVNLPEVCTISVYTVSGILVKKISKGDKGSTSVVWDLKNGSNIPISSGVYMIFVEAPGIGTCTLKFFCAMRPTDLNSF